MTMAMMMRMRMAYGMTYFRIFADSQFGVSGGWWVMAEVSIRPILNKPFLMII